MIGLSAAAQEAGGFGWKKRKSRNDQANPGSVKPCTVEGVQMFIVACPKDYTMYKDAVKTTGQEKTLVIKDLIELVTKPLEKSESAKLIRIRKRVMTRKKRVS